MEKKYKWKVEETSLRWKWRNLPGGGGWGRSDWKLLVHSTAFSPSPFNCCSDEFLRQSSPIQVKMWDKYERSGLKPRRGLSWWQLVNLTWTMNKELVSKTHWVEEYPQRDIYLQLRVEVDLKRASTWWSYLVEPQNVAFALSNSNSSNYRSKCITRLYSLPYSNSFTSLIFKAISVPISTRCQQKCDREWV